jgi:hypothetical protein
MRERTIEGKWDDVIQRSELRGRRVRVTVLDESVPSVAQPSKSAEDWVRELRAWAEAHPRTSHFVDDSRESIYGGTTDEPR